MKTAKNTAKSPAANHAPGAQASPAAPRRGGWKWKLLLLVNFAALAAGGYWWWQNQMQAQTSHSDRLAALEAQTTEFAPQRQQLAQRVESLQQTLQAQAEIQTRAAQENARLAGEVTALTEEITKLRAGFAAGADAFRLAEIEQLLVIAGQRLRLSAEVELALIALRLADEGLRRLAVPSFAETRELLAREIAALARVEEVDTVAALENITRLMQAVDALPVLGEPLEAESTPDAESIPDAGTPTPRAAEASGWRAWMERWVGDVSALVQFEDAGKPLAPILSAELRVMTLAKIQLILESAKIAFMRRQGALYTARLRAAERIVTEFFATDAPETRVWMQQLRAAAAVSPLPDLPDMGASLRALRAAMQPN